MGLGLRFSPVFQWRSYLVLTVFLIITAFITNSQCSVITGRSKNDIETDLVMLHAICRHGQRTTYNFYPTDPNKNHSFYPMGMGGMLNNGKYTGFRLGERLREEYGEFLGTTYTDDLILARSTDFPRTRMTAQVILAGLFPPNDEQSWHPTLKWLPIPVHAKEFEKEDLINPNCAYRKKLLEELPENEEAFAMYIKPYKPLFEYVEKQSGMKIKSLSQLVEFYFIISTEEEMGLIVPEWAKKIKPDIYKAASNVYKYQNFNPDVKKIHMGYFMKQIIKNMVAKAKNQLEPKGRKIFLFGAHESTLGWMMEHLGVLGNQIPPYSSSFIIEERKDKHGNFYVKLRYSDDLDAPIKDLKMPKCNVLCPLEKFIAFNEDVLPTVSLQEACHENATNATNSATPFLSRFSNLLIVLVLFIYLY